MPFQHAKLLVATKSMPPTYMRRRRDIIHKTPIGPPSGKNTETNIKIWLCLFFRCADFSKGGKFEFCEPYPRIIPRTIPRIIPANHTPKNHDYECFFWDRLGLHGLTSFNGRDKPLDKCWPDPMIPGCLHIPSRHEW